MTELTYLEYHKAELINAPLWWHKRGLQQTISGYSSKLTTPWKLRHDGRLKRVYVMCWSNAGTAYVLSRGEQLILRETD